MTTFARILLTSLFVFFVVFVPFNLLSVVLYNVFHVTVLPIIFSALSIWMSAVVYEDRYPVIEEEYKVFLRHLVN